MSTPEDLRKKFIQKAGPLLDQYIDAALGNGELKATSGQAMTAVWELLSRIVETAGDKTPLHIAGAGTSAQVEDLLKKVAAGELTPEQGKQYMTLIQSGFEITELPKVVAAMEKAVAAKAGK